MILLYTGAPIPEQTQENPAVSLGGYISITPVPNSISENLFDKVTKQELVTKQRQTRIIAIKNTTEAVVTNIEIWIVSDSSVFEYKMIGLIPTLDVSCNKYYFEKLSSDKQLPLTGTPTVYDEQSNSLDHASLDDQSYLGIVIVREIKQTFLDSNEVIFTSSDNNQEMSEEQLDYLQNGSESLPVEDSFELHISYT